MTVERDARPQGGEIRALFDPAGRPVDVRVLRSPDRRALPAAIDQALRAGAFLVVSATPHDLDATGEGVQPTPHEFAEAVRRAAQHAGLPGARLGLALAPLCAHRWRAGPSELAMARAEWLVARCVEAGFRLVQLDGATACVDDPAAMPARLAAARAARLCQAAERAYAGLAPQARGEPPCYLVRDAAHAPGAHRQAFDWRALAKAAWPRVFAWPGGSGDGGPTARPAGWHVFTASAEPAAA